MDTYGAYKDIELTRASLQSGPLDGLTFAVKDVVAVEGHVNSAGNPDWLRTHDAAEKNAPVIDLLLQNGASLKGMTHTDELMYSLNGENAHYGTPINPKVKDGIPGGSSSGSAVAVSAELVDFALGTDTGGSVRIPSSYCGIFGIRPTHGAVSLEGVIPLASSFDTVGWMANNPETLAAVGEVLLNDLEYGQPLKKAIVAEEAWRLLEDDVMESYHPVLAKLTQYIPAVPRSLTDDLPPLKEWAEAFRLIQGMEIWKAHEEWISEHDPVFGPGIRDRFQWISTLQAEDHAEAFELRKEVTAKLTELLENGQFLILPTAPGPAPGKGLPGDALEVWRSKAMQLTCIAGLTGFPQVTMPFGTMNEKPIGISILGAKGSDLALLELAKQLNERIKQGKALR